MSQTGALRSDEFASDDRAGAAARFDVTILPGDHPFSCARDQSVLKAMMARGLRTVAIGCRGGGCGVCRIRVVSGEFIALPMSRARISPTDERDGIVLACRIFPRSNLLIEALPLPGLTDVGR